MEWIHQLFYFFSARSSHTLWQLDFLHFLTSTQCPSRPRRCKLPAPEGRHKSCCLFFNIFLLLSHCVWIVCTERNASEKQNINGIRREGLIFFSFLSSQTIKRRFFIKKTRTQHLMTSRKNKRSCAFFDYTHKTSCIVLKKL